MKTIFKLFLPTVLALVAAACALGVDDTETHDVRKEITHFKVATEGTTATKIYVGPGLKIFFNESDLFTVFNKKRVNDKFIFNGGDGGGLDKVSDGSGSTDPLDYVYAVYPYDSQVKIGSDLVITGALPAEQNYLANSFGIGANPMVAVSDNDHLEFKNVCGYLSLRLFGDNVKVRRVTIKGNGGEKIAGKAKVTIPLGGVPTTEMDNSATEEISIVCEPAVELGETAENYTDFWFVIPPVTFSGGFTITVTDELGGTFVKTMTRHLTVTRNQLNWMSPLEVVPNYDDVFVPFEDANFKAYCVKNFDTNGDREISVAEAREVTKMVLIKRNIQSLSGIEYFTALTTLFCSSNRLTSLDVSHNTALTFLDCTFTQLTSLDVSHNTALTNLSCNENQLTSLDVSHNTALTNLSCNRNQLTSLDVSHNTVLFSLFCRSNQLTSLDVSHNSSLAFLTCDSNQLTSLDVSHNSVLHGLDCSSNQLTSLDVSHNTALTEFDCSSNQLTSLDVSHSTALWYLGCSSNRLTSLDVSHNTALTYLKCSSNPYLVKIWLKTGQSISEFYYDTNVATIYYKN